ncbi:hypothetical protein LTR27_012627 [Elasticomyces elasticus]|nr:hypothetical protein LTR27_012627 [Elasticomyces elasticus]
MSAMIEELIIEYQDKVRSSKVRDSTVRAVVGCILQEFALWTRTPRQIRPRSACPDCFTVSLRKIVVPIARGIFSDFQQDFQKPSDCSFKERDLDGLLSVLNRLETRVGPQPADLLQQVNRLQSAGSFPFMRLPDELRILICELVIPDQQRHILLPSACRCEISAVSTEPPITTVCRQLRHDSLPVFYASTNLSFHALRYDFSGLIAHCKAIKSWWGVKKIRMVKLCLGEMIIDYNDLTVKCGQGLQNLFRWISTTNIDVGFNVSRDGNFAHVNDVVRLARDCKASGLAGEGELQNAFDSWLETQGLHCRCIASAYLEGDTWYACSLHVPRRHQVSCGSDANENDRDIG